MILGGLLIKINLLIAEYGLFQSPAGGGRGNIELEKIILGIIFILITEICA